jgi:hypothetical protein
MLERRGLLARGQRDEALVVIRGRRGNADDPRPRRLTAVPAG